MRIEKYLLSGLLKSHVNAVLSLVLVAALGYFAATLIVRAAGIQDPTESAIEESGLMG
ncbi:MAG TPA: hypothetical protein VFL98_01475 [Candidatus Paceibacterota bacterium]|nr:hypothetical protein [Candidatus Paceibacterota bacterium]